MGIMTRFKDIMVMECKFAVRQGGRSREDDRSVSAQPGVGFCQGEGGDSVHYGRGEVGEKKAGRVQ